MHSLANTITPMLVLAVPLWLLAIGLIPSSWANASAKGMARLNGAFAWLAFGNSVVAAIFFLFATPGSWNLFSIDLPGNIGAFSVGTYVNSVTIIMLLLVSFVGAIVSRYARNYLDGESNQGRFHKWLSLTLASILTLIVSGNLLLFSFAWITTSLCLHQLLMFYKERPAAVLAAHKKFVASRVGDVSLLIAIALISSTLNTLDFEQMFNVMASWDGPLPAELHWAAALIVISAALKSAQFPFHGWLIQVMEAPTPVSALLHAGIVNAGAFLVIRMSPVVSQSSTALGLLAIIGLVTLALASLVMLTQTSIKVSLAWSTTAQMGFMLLECGLGLYSLAMLHLVAHSLYKAHAFLASGSGVDSFRAPAIIFDQPGPQTWLKATAFMIAVVMTLVIGIASGISLTEQPALIAAGAIVAIAMTQFLIQAISMNSSRAFLLRAFGMSIVVCVAYFALHHAFELALENSVLAVPENNGAFQMMLTLVIIAIFFGLLFIQNAFQTRRSQSLQSVYVHLYNGLYIDVYITRLLQRIWPAPAKLYGGQS